MVQDSRRTRQIVGFSLHPAMAKAVKVEAEKRGISLRKLFEEMWESHTKRAAK